LLVVKGDEDKRNSYSITVSMLKSISGEFKHSSYLHFREESIRFNYLNCYFGSSFGENSYTEGVSFSTARDIWEVWPLDRVKPFPESLILVFPLGSETQWRAYITGCNYSWTTRKEKEREKESLKFH
jgi:hypothetical protein